MIELFTIVGLIFGFGLVSVYVDVQSLLSDELPISGINLFFSIILGVSSSFSIFERGSMYSTTENSVC